MHKIFFGVTVLALLASCAPRTVTQIERHRVEPPASLTQPVPQPPLRGDTIGAVIQTIPDLRGALGQCNARLRDVRLWAEESATESEAEE
jgi:hypothetical protein